MSWQQGIKKSGKWCENMAKLTTEVERQQSVVITFGK